MFKFEYFELVWKSNLSVPMCSTRFSESRGISFVIFGVTELRLWILQSADYRKICLYENSVGLDQKLKNVCLKRMTKGYASHQTDREYICGLARKFTKSEIIFAIRCLRCLCIRWYSYGTWIEKLPTWKLCGMAGLNYPRN